MAAGRTAGQSGSRRKSRAACSVRFNIVRSERSFRFGYCWAIGFWKLLFEIARRHRRGMQINLDDHNVAKHSPKRSVRHCRQLALVDCEIAASNSFDSVEHRLALPHNSDLPAHISKFPRSVRQTCWLSGEVLYVSGKCIGCDDEGSLPYVAWARMTVAAGTEPPNAPPPRMPCPRCPRRWIMRR